MGAADSDVQIDNLGRVFEVLDVTKDGKLAEGDFQTFGRQFAGGHDGACGMVGADPARRRRRRRRRREQGRVHCGHPDGLAKDPPAVE